MRLSFVKVKTFRGMEGIGYNATLCVDGKAVAFVIDEGCGGCPHVEWKRDATPDEKTVLAWVETQSLVALSLAKTEDEEYPGGRKLADLYAKPWARFEGLLSHLLDEYENAKRMKRLAKTHVIMRDGDKTLTVRIRPGDTREKVEAYIAKAHPTYVIVREYNVA